MNKGLMTVREYVSKYGYHGLTLQVSRFIDDAPAQDPQREQALKQILDDLEEALKSVLEGGEQ